MEAFVADDSPEAFAKVVDRLLASPHYGERWAPLLARPGALCRRQSGASKDTPYPNAFRYRDWVIQAFNDDMPYDVFVKAQIAADLLDDAADSAKIFCRVSAFWRSGRNADERSMSRRKTFLGLNRRLRAVPRSQVRSDPDERLLFAARRFQEHDGG